MNVVCISKNMSSIGIHFTGKVSDAHLLHGMWYSYPVNFGGGLAPVVRQRSLDQFELTGESICCISLLPLEDNLRLRIIVIECE